MAAKSVEPARWEVVDSYREDRINHGPRRTVRLKVPGGWIYYTEQYDPDEAAVHHGAHMPIYVTSVFVPGNDVGGGYR